MDKEIQLQLRAKKRDVLGRKTKRLRAENLLPAILYGPKIKNIPLVLDYKSFEKVWSKAGESSLINLEIEGEKKKYLVLIHDIQQDPLTDKIIHIDLYQPDLEKKVTAWVPLVIVGEAPAVKNLGGTLVRNLDEVEVRALPRDLPHEIKVDVSNLKEIHDEILIEDLQVPNNVEILKNPKEVVVTVAPPERVEEELAEEKEEIKEPEVIKEKKEEAEEKEQKQEEG
ncbi:50S ribosomal protein L25 [bacterium]|nr:50S ribosomal protein L25 [bacterium]